MKRKIDESKGGGSKGYEWESVEGMVGDVMGQAKEVSWNGNDKKYQ